MSILVIVAIAVVAAVLLLILLFTAAWKVAEPNEALIISGLHNKSGEEGKGFRIVTGRGTVVIPGIQKARRLDLSAHRVTVDEPCVTTQGIDVTISAVVLYKIGDDLASIANASRRFLSQEEQMDSQVHDVFAGHLRSVVGSVTMEDLITNRQTLAEETRSASTNELQKLGLILDSLQIDRIGDPSGYIANLGAPHVAHVQSQARIAQAEANQAAVKREQETAAANAENARDSEVKQAMARSEIEAAKARAAQSGPLAEAESQQQVVSKQTELAELAAARTEKELESQVRKPADAEAYRNITLAEAAKKSTILNAEAEAEKTRLSGVAQAGATEAIGQADGSALAARRDALSHGGDAVIAQLLAEKYPEIVREAAAAYAHVGNMTVLNGTEGVNAGILGVIAQGSALFGPLRDMATRTGNSTDDVVHSAPKASAKPAAAKAQPKDPDK